MRTPLDIAASPAWKLSSMAVDVLKARADAKAADLAPIIKELQAAGRTSLRAIAAGLNDAGIPTGWTDLSPPWGKRKQSPAEAGSSLSRILFKAALWRHASTRSRFSNAVCWIPAGL
jgi:hypothetical protein